MGKRPRRWRRLAIRLAACAGVGAVVTVGVAWALAIDQPYHGWPNWRGRYHSEARLVLPHFRYKAPRGDVFVNYLRGRGWSEVLLTAEWTRRDTQTLDSWRKTAPYPQDVAPKVAAVFGNPRSYELPAWALRPGDGPDPQNIKTFAWGWPFRALCGGVESYLNSAPAGPYTGASDKLRGFLTRKAGFLGDQHAALPRTIASPGFALDTAFYAAIALTLWSAPPLIRRRLRRARGHCPACGYNLKGAPSATCPECGR
jgi:hypothetical protein